MGSGVTNFLSTIEARSLGTADIDKMSAAIDKQSAALLGLGKSGDKVNEHPGFNAFAEKIKQGIEDPLGAIGTAAKAALESLGPLGAGVAAAVGTFAAVSFAAFEAAKALGEYGLQIRDVELRTGLAAKEVGQYSFAAKAVGQDVSILDRMMRGLTMAVEDNTSKGAKAREWLQKFGVDITGLKDGTASTSEALTKVGAGLEALPAGIGRTSAAIDIFKRAGIEAIPFLVELNANLTTAQDLGFGPSEDQVTRFNSYLKDVVILETKWASLARSFKEPLASVLMVTIKGVMGDNTDVTVAAVQALKGQIGKLSPDQAQDRLDVLKRSGMVSAGTLNSLQSDINSAADKNLFAPQRQWQNTGIRVTGYGSGATPGIDLSGFGREIDAALSGDPLSEAKKKLSTLQDDLRSKRDLKAPLTQQGELAEQIEKQKAVVAGIEAQTKATKELEAAEKSRSAARVAAAIKGIEADTKLSNDTAAKLLKGGRELYLNANGGMPEWAANEKDAFDFANTGKNISAMRIGPSQWQKEKEFSDWWASVQEGNAREGQRGLRDSQDNARRGLGLFGAQAALGGVSEVDQVHAAEVLKKNYAKEEYDWQVKIAEAKNDSQAKEDAAAQQHQKYLDAEIETQQALLQMALRQKQEFQSMFVGGVEALIHGQGGSFLQSQGTRMFDQVLGNAAGMAWKDVSKLIPHASGTVGKLLEGTMFGADPAKAATDANTLATIANTTAIEQIGIGGGASGGGFSSARGTFARLLMGGGAPTDAEIAAAGITAGDMAALQKVPAAGPNQGAGYSIAGPSRGGGWGKAVGIGGAAVAGAYGAYSGFSQGSARGDLTGAGSLVGAAGTIMMLAGMTGPAAPIVAGIGLALGLIPSLMGDPKKQRADQLSQEAQQRAYTMPTGADYSMDARGRYSDYNYRGETRTTNVYVNAMDAKSMVDYFTANPTILPAGLSSSIAGGNADDVIGLIQARNN